MFARGDRAAEIEDDARRGGALQAGPQQDMRRAVSSRTNAGSEALSA